MKTPTLILCLSLAALGAQAATDPPSKKAKARKTVIQQKLAPLPPADEQQIHAAGMAHIGRYVCEAGQEILLDRNDANPGYLNLRYKKQAWVMRPVLSTTGALRIEDTRGQALLLQIAFKSMLMNTKTGQRLVDNCVHEAQKAAEAAAAGQPTQPSLFGQ